MHPTISVLAVVMLAASVMAGDIGQPWARHTIDDSSEGADGTRLADANGDGHMDFVTGWEQGGITRIYLNPGPEHARNKWPAVTVGDAASVEDAVLVDLDGDGSLDVVSCCEGKRQVILVHWAPKQADYVKPERWVTREIPNSENLCRWMFSAPMNVDGDGRVDLLAGGKGEGSQLGWWKVSEDARDLESWQWNPLRPMGWLMSLEAIDMDGDGDQDILFTDRKGDRRGCYWLEQPQSRTDPWQEHKVGAIDREAMFLRRVDVDRDGMEDVLIAVRPQSLVLCRRMNKQGTSWKEYEVDIPLSYGGAKAVHAADLNGDDSIELVFSTERATDGKMGVGRVVTQGNIFTGQREITSISGVDGVKHDLVELIDLDGDGDLDVLTCEEVKNLGVIWYENPSSGH